MSRHAIPPRKPGISVTVGWDNPLSTFFAEVTQPPASGDKQAVVLLWIGASASEITRPEELAEPLAPYAILTEDVVTALRADRAACLDRSPTPLQRIMLSTLSECRSPCPRRAPVKKAGNFRAMPPSR